MTGKMNRKSLLLFCVTIAMLSCARQPILNLSGDWSTVPSFGGHVLSLTHHGQSINGSGAYWSCSTNVNLKVAGEIRDDRLKLTFTPGYTLPNPRTFVLVMSPKGSKHFLKCLDNPHLSLIPKDIVNEYYKYDILKKEFVEMDSRPTPPYSEPTAWPPQQ